MSARAVSTWRPELAWRIHFQCGSLTWLANWCELLARGLNSSPWEPLHGAAGVSSHHAGWLTLEWAIQETNTEAVIPLMTWPWNPHTFIPYSTGHTGQPWLNTEAGREPHKGVNARQRPCRLIPHAFYPILIIKHSSSYLFIGLNKLNAEYKQDKPKLYI